jgi:hypothetical protein
MFDAASVLAQAQVGPVPPSWHIFRAKRAGPLLAALGGGCLGLFFLVFCGIFALVPLLGLLALQQGSALSSGRFPLGEGVSADQLVALGSGLAVAVVGLGALIGGSRAARVHNDPLPLLAITPEGYVEYINSRKPVTTVAFADLTSLAQRLQVTRTTHQNQPGNAAAGSYTTTSTAVWLDLSYRDGRKVRWRQRARFGAPLAILQAIIAAQAQYVVAHPHPTYPS